MSEHDAHTPAADASLGADTIRQVQTAYARLREEIRKVIVGQDEVVEQMLLAIMGRGHAVVVGVPGLAKTLLISTIARALNLQFSRIQFTPDLMPSDITGTEMIQEDRGTGHREFRFVRGPVFANVVLADEINRTPPRTQAALLEAMSDATVSIDGRAYDLPTPFMVVATQNPFDFEGTYLLPENQLDRFLMRVKLGYPTPEQEARVLDMRPAAEPLHTLKPVLHAADIVALQNKVDTVKVSGPLLQYIVEFANATRNHGALQLGISPRGALALTQAARATALATGREYATTEDVVENVTTVCAHRVITRSSLGASSESAEDVLGSILRSVPAPV